MGISVEQWRAAIGSYNARKSCSIARSFYTFQFLLALSILRIVAGAFLQAVMTAMMLRILLSGDVERNPGPYNMGKLHWLQTGSSYVQLGLGAGNH